MLNENIFEYKKECTGRITVANSYKGFLDKFEHNRLLSIGSYFKKQIEENQIECEFSTALDDNDLSSMWRHLYDDYRRTGADVYNMLNKDLESHLSNIVATVMQVKIIG